MTAPARFFDGLTASAQPVEAALAAGMLTLSAGDVILASWPAADLVRCDDGGSAGTAILRPQQGAQRVHLADASLIEALCGSGAKIAAQGRWTGRHWSGIAAAMIASLAVGALLVEQLPNIVTPLVPHRLEHVWSDNARAAIMAFAAPCTGQAGSAALNGLVARIAGAAGVSPVPTVVVLDTDIVNAFTLPDGNILVFRGLIARAQDPDELSGVLAHEMGHAKHRDPTREMVRRTALGMVARSFGWGGNLASTMTGLSYGRRAEAAADASALTTLDRAGLRADGLGRFMGRLAHNDAGVPGFLSDHPSSESRAALLARPASGVSALSPVEWDAVRGICR